jgi:flavin reductase (DIM6/NTAB) family NADH-FMN oxidoreductase RutF
MPPMTEFTPCPETSREFRNALGQFGTGVTVVTTSTPDGPIGMTANSFAAVSLDPPLVLWSPARASLRFTHFEKADRYAIHVLRREQQDLAQRFAEAADDFAGIDWAEGAGGVPILRDSLARFECRLSARHDGGDHSIIVGRVLNAVLREGAPLLFVQGRYGGFATD